MNRERTLGVLAVAVLLFGAALVVAAPGALAEKSDTSVRPTHLDLREPRVSAGEVGGETAELSLDLRLAHRGGPAENVTVEVQAIDTDTGLVATTVRKRLGRIPATSAGPGRESREVRTRVNVSVKRQGGYRLDIRVYENDSRVATGRTTVRGVKSLVPDYADTPVEFHRFGERETSLPVISYSIQDTENNRTALETQTFLTNRGDEPAGDLTLVVKARQVESNVVADEATVQVGEIRPGRTEAQTARLTVPADYNYYLDAILLRDDVVVGTATSSATLDPTRPVPENETTEEVEFNAGDFASSPTPEPERADAGAEPPATATSSGPGFGIVVGLAALLALTAVLTRRRNA